MPLTVGTAGHVDHGKTTLVRALTGKDTDRLPEEQARGISIDLGYAPLELPSGRTLSLVDVPGHERFVRTMVAGATGIDLFLLVLDAAEGARPQTHEHLAILRLLGVERGVVAVTKADTVDEETLELALEEARELVPGAPVVAVSGVTGARARRAPRERSTEVAGDVEQRRTDFPTRLYVDRVFTLRGIGTIATGTLWSGTIADGDRLRLEPAGRDVRVRSVQVHDAPVERAEAGQRVAVSLPGLERSDLSRGDALVAEGAFPRSYRLEVSLEELEPIADGARLSVHHGTSRIPGRVVRVGADHAQLRLAEPVHAARGDRLVLRGETTVGGATVLDPAPPRGRDVERDRLLEAGDPASIVRALVAEPVRVEELAARALLERGGARGRARRRARRRRLGVLRGVARRDGDARRRTGSGRPRRGVPARARPVARRAPPRAVGAGGARVAARRATRRDRRAARAPRRRSERARTQAAGLEQPSPSAGLEATKVEDAELARYLESEGRLVRLGDGYAVGAGAYEVARDLVVTECAAAGEITLARFRDLAGVGRRDAQLLLERMDVDGLTRRLGDRRVLRRAGRTREASTPAPAPSPRPPRPG